MQVTTEINDGLWFTDFLGETKANIEAPFTSLKWLQWIPIDTLKMLSEYFDNFDKNILVENVNDQQAEDIIALSLALLKLESDEPEWVENYPKTHKVVQSLMAMVTLESMRRKGLVKIEGNGKLIGDTAVSLSVDGKVAQEMLNGIGRN